MCLEPNNFPDFEQELCVCMGGAPLHSAKQSTTWSYFASHGNCRSARGENLGPLRYFLGMHVVFQIQGILSISSGHFILQKPSKVFGLFIFAPNVIYHQVASTKALSCNCFRQILQHWTTSESGKMKTSLLSQSSREIIRYVK